MGDRHKSPPVVIRLAHYHMLTAAESAEVTAEIERAWHEAAKDGKPLVIGPGVEVVDTSPTRWDHNIDTALTRSDAESKCQSAQSNGWQVAGVASLGQGQGVLLIFKRPAREVTP